MSRHIIRVEICQYVDRTAKTSARLPICSDRDRPEYPPQQRARFRGHPHRLMSGHQPAGVHDLDQRVVPPDVEPARRDVRSCPFPASQALRSKSSLSALRTSSETPAQPARGTLLVSPTFSNSTSGVVRSALILSARSSPLMAPGWPGRSPAMTSRAYLNTRAWHLLNQFCRSALWSPPAWSVARRVVRCAQFSGMANRPYDEISLLHRDRPSTPSRCPDM